MKYKNIFVSLTQEEYNKLKEDKKIDEDKIYLTEENKPEEDSKNKNKV